MKSYTLVALPLLAGCLGSGYPIGIIYTGTEYAASDGPHGGNWACPYRG